MRSESNRRNGQSIVLFLILLGIMAGIMSLSFDMGRGYLLKTRMQSAADAASLAAARELPFIGTANAVAMNYAQRNGFVNGVDGITVEAFPYPSKSNWYYVKISGPSNHLIAPLIGFRQATVSVMAVSEFNAYLPLDISGGGQYGTNGIVTLSVFGPYAYYSYGDAFSTKWLDNGSLNPDYKANGYDFVLNVPNDYYAKNGTNLVKLEIFDPDTYNNGGTDAYPGVRIDEIRSAPGGSHPQPSNQRNTTVYSLYAPDNTPNDYSDDVLVATAVYGPNVTTTDMKWVTPSGFTFNINNYGTGNYRVNVKSTDGSSENGFNLRAGPSTGAFDPANGTSINALGALPMNFNGSGVVTVKLGYVAGEAAGKNMHVNKFDTDVGAKSITYKCDALPGQWTGTLSDNGKWKEDIVSIPAGYTGGTWTATYTAGLQDTSVWTMWFEGTVQGQPGFVRLVK